MTRAREKEKNHAEITNNHGLTHAQHVTHSVIEQYRCFVQIEESTTFFPICAQQMLYYKDNMLQYIHSIDEREKVFSDAL